MNTSTIVVIALACLVAPVLVSYESMRSAAARQLPPEHPGVPVSQSSTRISGACG